MEGKETIMDKNMYEEIINVLKSIPKEFLLVIIHDLMKDDKLSFVDLAKVHNDYLEELRTKQNREYDNLRVKVISLWCEKKKKYRNDRLKEIMHYLLDLGQLNTTHEEIDKR